MRNARWQWEAKNPWIMDKMELRQDSGGPGKWRGGLGIDQIERVRSGGLTSLDVMRTAGLEMAFGSDLLGELQKITAWSSRSAPAC